MNKVFALWLTVILVLVAVTGCTGSGNAESDAENTVVESTANDIAEDETSSETKTSSEAKTLADVPRVTLLVTRDFGREKLLESTVELGKNWTVYDLLIETAEIEADYGGSFVTGINGLTTQGKAGEGKRLDWFYYINGICADVGAIDYDLSSGDIVWWDYHAWNSMDSINSAVTGMYPEPFVNGYRSGNEGLNILYAEGSDPLAEELKNAMEEFGIHNIEVNKAEATVIGDRSKPTILIGSWEALREFEYLSKMNDQYKKLGHYTYFEDGEMKVLTDEYTVAATLGSRCGTIYAHGDGLGDTAGLWVVAGIDEEGTETAVKALVQGLDDNTSFDRTYGLYIKDDEVLRLPME